MKLALENISKNYGEKKALDRISFLVKTGVYGFLGSKDVGKSMLMKVVSCITTLSRKWFVTRVKNKQKLRLTSA